VQPVQQCGEHVEFGGVRMLGTVVLTRDRPEHLGGGLPGLVDEGLGLLRDFEIDHAVTTPSMTPIARRSRYQRSTGCSLMNPCPPSSWTPVLPIHMPLSVASLRASATSRAYGLPCSAREAARSITNRMPPSSMPMSATWNATPCRWLMGSPNASRSLT